MPLRKPSLRELRQAEQDARDLARALLSGAKVDLSRVSRTLREQTEALVREAKQDERERKRDISALRQIFKREGRKLKRRGHGLAKQLSEYQPQIAAEKAKRAAAGQRRKDARIRRHARYIQEVNDYRLKIGESAVEHAGALFLDLPREVQNEYINKSDLLRRDRQEKSFAELGIPFDPFAPYH